jgi:hypothetical protein
MSGAKRLAVSELSEEAKGLKGKAYLDAVEKEFKQDHVVNEGSEEDNEETSDKVDAVQEKEEKE